MKMKPSVGPSKLRALAERLSSPRQDENWQRLDQLIGAQPAIGIQIQGTDTDQSDSKVEEKKEKIVAVNTKELVPDFEIAESFFDQPISDKTDPITTEKESTAPVSPVKTKASIASLKDSLVFMMERIKLDSNEHSLQEDHLQIPDTTSIPEAISIPEEPIVAVNITDVESN